MKSKYLPIECLIIVDKTTYERVGSVVEINFITGKIKQLIGDKVIDYPNSVLVELPN